MKGGWTDGRRWTDRDETGGYSTGPTLSSSLLSFLSTYVRFLGSVPTAEGSSVYDSNPDESLKRDFQDCASVTRRNGSARKNLPWNDLKLFAAYKLQSAQAEVIPLRAFDELNFQLAVMIYGK